MTLAHALDQSGPHLEVLIVAAGFFLLGIVFFIQKSVKPVVSVTLAVLAAAMATGAFVLGPESPAAEDRRIVVQEPKPGDVIEAGKPVPLKVGIVGGRLASSATAGDGGHLHILVDGALSMPPPSQEPELDPLEPGRHEIVVEFVDRTHRSFTPKVRDAIEITAE
jgi:hypothetical protein